MLPAWSSVYKPNNATINNINTATESMAYPPKVKDPLTNWNTRTANTTIINIFHDTVTVEKPIMDNPSGGMKASNETPKDRM